MNDRNRTTAAFVSSTSGKPDSEITRGDNYLLRPEEVHEEVVERTRTVHTSAFARSRDPQLLAVRRAMRLGHRPGNIVSLDPNYDSRVWPDKEEAWEVLAKIMPYITIVKPSLEDTRRFFDHNLDDVTLRECSLNEFHDLGTEVVIFTSSGGVVTVSNSPTVEQVGPLTRLR
jgi:sugar/nucleoside kinase (ribokinase family)